VSDQINGTPVTGGPVFQNLAGSAPRGLYAGHLSTSNYLFVDGHVKALRAPATAVPLNMWSVNKQQSACAQMVDSANGLGYVDMYYASGVRN